MDGMREGTCWIRRWGLLLVMTMAVAAAREGKGEEYTVGGAAGMWDIPSLSNINYTMWALWNNYFVGDSLLFRYHKGEHSVLEVTFKDYQNCKNARPIAVYEEGNTRVILDKYGPYYFICGTPAHCSLGQKFKIDVSDYQRAYPPPSPSPSSRSTLSPSPATYAPFLEPYTSRSATLSHSYTRMLQHTVMSLLWGLFL